MSNWVMKKGGKIREVWENTNGRVLLVASDRVAGFNDVLPNIEIPDKGKLLTQISAFWFKHTEGVAPNAFITCDNNEMEGLVAEEPQNQGRCMLMKKLSMLPIEAIVRGNICGTLWEAYESGKREFSGLPIPEGIRRSESLPKPMFTPSTKEPAGVIDRNLSFEEMIEHIRRAGFEDAEFIAERVREYSLALYNFGREYAITRGLIVAQVKFEFGIDENGVVVLGDELFTPDSTRFWLKSDFKIGEQQEELDKIIIQHWLDKNPGEKEIPSKTIELARSRYVECYERIVGGRFCP